MLYAYIDESGNTGSHLLDPEQPFFTSVAMTSQVDFDNVFRQRVSRIADSIDVPFLHASEMGPANVEIIASSLIELVQFSQVKFHFTLIHKPSVVMMKFYDALFDPWENPAAPRHSYVIRPLRFALLQKFASVVDDNDLKLFWNTMTNKASPNTVEDSVQAIGNILRRVPTLPDYRSRQLIGDTLTWAKEHISSLSFWSEGKQSRYEHLPNIFTFLSLLAGISSDARDWGTRVERIIHDRQSQFEKVLRQWHSTFEGIGTRQIFHFGDTQFEFPDIQDSRFEIGDSKEKPGLQVADVVLWIFSRIISDKPVGATSSELVEICFHPESLYIMSLESVVAEAASIVRVAMTKPLSSEQIRETEKWLEEIEQQRQESMREGISQYSKLPKSNLTIYE